MTGELLARAIRAAFLKRVNFFGKHTTGTYVTGHCSCRRRWNSRSEQLRCWNVRNLGVARCLIGQIGRVNHESASSDIWMDASCFVPPNWPQTDPAKLSSTSCHYRVCENIDGTTVCVTADWSMNLVKLFETAMFWFCLNLICKILFDGKVFKDSSAAS